MSRCLWMAALVVAMLLALPVLHGCSGSSAPPADQTSDTIVDSSPWPDLPQPDQIVWPDQGRPDQQIWPDTYSDTYSGAPFGCQADSDCFGQKCCATPWGVKLCAATCFR